MYILFCSRCEWPQKAGPPDVHQVPDAWAGEGVPHEPLPDPAATNRDGARAVPDGTTDQDLVPEPPDEAQKRDTGD